jgi:hypothetical protein
MSARVATAHARERGLVTLDDDAYSIAAQFREVIG